MAPIGTDIPQTKQHAYFIGFTLLQSEVTFYGIIKYVHLLGNYIP